ncbi:hypothetical protein BC938DRAFT_480159 [Jimgerdemannia flammicorona]|uniref:Uncharacterized protein n=1 Tax=Jimgerdemannia flammicorona TaxID=994334 RepID=A0A433QXI8_9FUNG|nr:hypothetical protein BC938DRAFT_480159 [Jimgerdemannia flammicorona]
MAAKSFRPQNKAMDITTTIYALCDLSSSTLHYVSFTDLSELLSTLLSILSIHLRQLSLTHVFLLLLFLWLLRSLRAHLRRLPAPVSPRTFLEPRDSSLVLNDCYKLPVGTFIRLYAAGEVEFQEGAERLAGMDRYIDFRLGIRDLVGLVWHAGVLGVLWRGEGKVEREWFEKGGDFHTAYLGSTMSTASAHFTHPDMKLEDAQLAKMEHISTNLLGLRPQDRVLDLELEWGFAAGFMVRKVEGVRVVGIAATEEQGGIYYCSIIVLDFIQLRRPDTPPFHHAPSPLRPDHAIYSSPTPLSP